MTSANGGCLRMEARTISVPFSVHNKIAGDVYSVYDAMPLLHAVHLGVKTADIYLP